MKTFLFIAFLAVIAWVLAPLIAAVGVIVGIYLLGKLLLWWLDRSLRSKNP